MGVAPGARLWSVKVLGSDGGGSLAGILAGLDWVTGMASTIEVANLRLGCADCGSAAMSRAITTISSVMAWSSSAENVLKSLRLRPSVGLYAGTSRSSSASPE